MKHLRDFVSSVPEYRRTGKGNFRHKLEDMLMLVILGRLSKCITRADILQFGKQHLKRLQSQGMFRHGLPSEATLCRVSQGIDDEKMAGCLAAFAEIFRKEAAVPGLAEIICIDGKATRGTLYGNGRTPNIVSAYSPDLGLTLATDACEEKSNEIKSVPVLLDKLDISGHVITADAMSFQKAIIDKIKGKGGDFVIELKAQTKGPCAMALRMPLRTPSRPTSTRKGLAWNMAGLRQGYAGHTGGKNSLPTGKNGMGS